MKKILVTGAGGHVGGVLIEALNQRYPNHLIRAMLSPNEQAPHLTSLNCEIIHADITQPDTLEAAFAGIDEVYHLAAFISWEATPKALKQLELINHLGTKNIIEAAIKHRVGKLLYCSSSEALDPRLASQLDESCPLVTSPNPMPYGFSKANAERAVRVAIQQHNLPAVIIYPTGIIGPFNRRLSASTSQIIRWAKGQSVPMPDAWMNWVDVRDVAHGAILALDKGVVGEGYLLSSQHIHFEELVGYLEDHGIHIPLKIKVPMPLLNVIAPIIEFAEQWMQRPPSLTRAGLTPLKAPKANTQKAQHDLNWQPMTVKQSISDTLMWLKQNGYC